MFSSAASPSSIHSPEFQSPETSIFAVNHRRRQHMKLLFLPPLSLPHPNPLKPTKISCFYNKSPNPNPKLSSSGIRRSSTPTPTPTPTPPRDIVIDFGKHKGKMLGTLPSSYLKWVSKNLRTSEFLEWAKLADQVLEDPVYKDRIEWEFADRLLTGNSASVAKSSGWGTGEELLELSQRFGWDFGSDSGWGKVDFKLLGTSFGGRLPRVDPNKPRDGGERKAPAKREKASAAMGGEVSARERRRERMRLKRGERSSAGRSRVARSGNFNGGNDDDDDDDDDDDEEVDENPTAEVDPKKRFPGRESLWKKAVDRERLL